MGPIYLDNNATTPLLPAVEEAMRPLLGNPASAHHAGRQARRSLEDTRERLAVLLDAHPDELIFTSGATEANNLAVFGLVDAPGHVLASPVEHPSVAEPVRRLAEQGFAVDWLPVDETGLIAPDALAERLREETRLVCVQFANHETGAVQPISSLASGGREPPECVTVGEASLPRGAHAPRSPAFHCDAVQAVGKLPVRFHELGVTTLSLSAHKFHGPPGIGALLVRRGVKLRPLLWGGHQQHGRRPGTEPVALALGLVTALDLAVSEMAERRAKVEQLRHLFLESLREASPFVLNGPITGSVPHTLNVSFPGCQADALLMNLDLEGVACSTGSACSSGSLLPSPVLQAMGVPAERLHSAMRFSMSPLLSEDEISEAGRRIVAVVRRLRSAT
jgi:cysteine desulfurase